MFFSRNYFLISIPEISQKCSIKKWLSKLWTRLKQAQPWCKQLSNWLEFISQFCFQCKYGFSQKMFQQFFHSKIIINKFLTVKLLGRVQTNVFCGTLASQILPTAASFGGRTLNGNLKCILNCGHLKCGHQSLPVYYYNY